MSQKNHFTIKDGSGGLPLVEITRRADVVQAYTRAQMKKGAK